MTEDTVVDTPPRRNEELTVVIGLYVMLKRLLQHIDIVAALDDVVAHATDKDGISLKTQIGKVMQNAEKVFPALSQIF